MAEQQDVRITEAIGEERARLRNFIRRRVRDTSDVEDILQDVFYEFVQAYRAVESIEHVSAWLFRVARNKITDLFRKKRPGLLDDELSARSEEGERLDWEEWLPSDSADPEDVFAQKALAEALQDALAELPDEQQQVFVAHEIEGRSFKEISGETGVSVNTLLSRKHYAVLHLQRKLKQFYEELGS